MSKSDERRHRNALALSVAESVRRLRVRRGLTRIKLAELSGVGRNTIWRIENCRTDADLNTVRRLAVALDATVAINLVAREQA